LGRIIWNPEMLVKQGHEPAVGKGKLPRGAQSRFRPLAADLGFYEQIMRSAEFGDDPPSLFFSFLLANGFDREPLQAFSYAWGSNGEGKMTGNVLLPAARVMRWRSPEMAASSLAPNLRPVEAMAALGSSTSLAWKCGSVTAR
jgi:hypothetical protein